MTTARAGLEHPTTSAAGHPDLAMRHHHRPSKLFAKDHAYAARLVQIATAICSVVRSTTTMKVPDRVPSETRGDDKNTGGTDTRPGAHESGS
jgi:membrane-associated PAP2 superfamily phosphatase